MSEDVSVEVSVDRLSVAEAAAVLGVTRDAIHKRITRGSIEYEKGEDGRFYVFVDTSTQRLDSSTDTSKDESKVETLERLIESQQDRIAFLEHELERRGDEAERLHQIVAGLTRTTAELSARIPQQLEAPRDAPSETPGDHETAEESPEGAQPRSSTPASQSASEEPVGRQGTPRPWWSRIFGG